MTKYFILSISVLALLGCKPKITIEDPSFGDVNPSKFIAIGGSSTAGYSDGAFNLNGQENSYIAIIAKQFNEVSSVNFKQALSSSTGINLDGESRLIMGYKTDCKGETSLSPVREASAGDNSILGANVFGSGPFSNLGVPDLDILKINTAGYGNSSSGAGNYNPYYSRIASDEVNGTILGDALSQTPTFFSLRLGEQAILNYATNGGTIPLPATNGAAGTGFDGSLDEVVSTLSGTGANGVIANIPNVLDYPFFTTIPYDGLELDSTNAALLNSVYNPLGINFQVGKNGFAIDDPSQPFGVRKMVEGELLLLSIPLDSVKCLGLGSIYPLQNQYVLTIEEIDSITTKINEYNAIIEQKASAYGVALVDLSYIYSSLKSGMVYNGINLSTEFVSGGSFSLDGLNLNPRGQAIVANKFLEVINKRFNANIPYADAIKYTGIIFP